MDDLEFKTCMTDAEADMETLEDMRRNMGQFAEFLQNMMEENDEI